MRIFKKKKTSIIAEDFTMNITNDEQSSRYENNISENVLGLFNEKFINNQDSDKTLISILNKAQKDLEKKKKIKLANR